MQHYDFTPPAGAPIALPAPPMRQYVDSRPPGISLNGNYMVLPLASLEQMEPQWQAHFAQLLAHYHRRLSGAPWPVYRVDPVHHTRLEDLDEEGLAQVGVIQELGDDDQIEYRDLRAGQSVKDPDDLVFVVCEDPLADCSRRPHA